MILILNNYKKIHKNVYFLPKSKKTLHCFYQIFVIWFQCFTLQLQYIIICGYILFLSMLRQMSNANTTVILSWTTHPASVSGLNSRTVVSRVPPQLLRTVAWLQCYTNENSGSINRILLHTHLLDNTIKQCKHSTWSGTWTQGCD